MEHRRREEMKRHLLAAVTVAAIAFQPVYANNADAGLQPKKFKVDAPAEFPSFREMEEQAKKREQTGRMVFHLTPNVSLGRVQLQPFQTYAGSYTYTRRLIGVSVHFSF